MDLRVSPFGCTPFLTTLLRRISKRTPPQFVLYVCMKICFTLSSSHFKWRQSMCLLFKYPCIPPILKFTLFFCASKEAGLAQEFRETFYKQLLLAISVAYCHWASITNANGTAQSQCRTYAPQVPRTLEVGSVGP